MITISAPDGIDYYYHTISTTGYNDYYYHGIRLPEPWVTMTTIRLPTSHILLIFPFPHFIDKFLSAEIVTGKFLFPHQLFLYHDLRGNAGVITAGVPKHGLPVHTVPGGKFINNTLCLLLT